MPPQALSKLPLTVKPPHKQLMPTEIFRVQIRRLLDTFIRCLTTTLLEQNAMTQGAAIGYGLVVAPRQSFRSVKNHVFQCRATRAAECSCNHHGRTVDVKLILIISILLVGVTRSPHWWSYGVLCLVQLVYMNLYRGTDYSWHHIGRGELGVF